MPRVCSTCNVLAEAILQGLDLFNLELGHDGYMHSLSSQFKNVFSYMYNI